MAFKRNKKKPKMYRGKKSKYSVQEKRSYWTGYGIALERMKSDSPGYPTKGSIHLNSGYVPSIESACKGYDAAMKHKDNDYKLSNPFYPKGV